MPAGTSGEGPGMGHASVVCISVGTTQETCLPYNMYVCMQSLVRAAHQPHTPPSAPTSQQPSLLRSVFLTHEQA